MSDEKKEQGIKLTRRNSREQNLKVQERAIWTSKEMKEFRESIKTRYGLDMKDPKVFPAHDPDFSWSKFKSKVMRETNSASAQAQLLRAGIQTAVNNMYTSIPTTYEDWTHNIQSNKDTELYAPLNALSFPAEVGPGEKYIEANVIGLDIKLKNRKFGQVFPVEWELLEDDQTGQMQQKVQEMAEYAKLIWEVYCYGKLASVSSMSYSNLTVPTSETKPSTESNYPWSTSLVGGGATKPGSFLALNVGNLKTVLIALENQLNLMGLKMNVVPDKILSGPFYRFDIATILNSNYYPAGAQSAGTTGGAFAINVLKGIADPVISRFMFDQNGSVSNNSKAWYVCDSSKPFFVVQMREAASVTQEDPNSGESFSRDIIRTKLRVRGNADFIEPRFAYIGSDGSV